jgi:PAS domain|tara:strand:+ start:39739 stop:40188 length:450 start_codon:yes stop_codon:yes gene_type:complete
MINTSDFIPDFTDEDLTSRHQKDFFYYYNKIKADRQIPSRSDINPADIVKILPHLILIEKSRGKFTVRLMGTKCASVLGERTGKSLNSIDGSTEEIDRLTWSSDNKRPYFHKSLLDKISKKHVKSSAIVMPLSENNNDVNMFVAVHHFY